METGITDKMQVLTQKWQQQNDARAIFLHCYLLMTQNMLLAIQQQRFQDNPWVRHLLHRFADYYFDALTQYDQQNNPPRIWAYTHESAQQAQLHPLQHLLLGVNAHINYDLVLTLHEILGSKWLQLTDSQKKERYQDHCLVNTIIAETIDQVQDEVIEKYAPRMDWVDRLMGPLDEHLIALLIRRWRTQVWERAMAFCHCGEGKEQQKLQQELEKAVIKTAQWITKIG